MSKLMHKKVKTTEIMVLVNKSQTLCQLMCKSAVCTRAKLLFFLKKRNIIYHASEILLDFTDWSLELKSTYTYHDCNYCSLRVNASNYQANIGRSWKHDFCHFVLINTNVANIYKRNMKPDVVYLKVLFSNLVILPCRTQIS